MRLKASKINVEKSFLFACMFIRILKKLARMSLFEAFKCKIQSGFKVDFKPL